MPAVLRNGREVGVEPTRWYERGVEHLAARARDAAAGAFEHALEADPAAIGSLVGLARAFERQRLFTRAVDTWRRATAIAPHNPPLATGLAEALRSTGCLADAE